MVEQLEREHAADCQQSGVVSRRRRAQQHRVAVAEEAVALRRSRARYSAIGCARSRRTRSTSISSVLLGRWKLVTSRSTTRNAKPGVMKMSVSRAPAASASPAASAADFERAQRGRADRDDAAAARARVRAIAATRRRRHLVPLAVHAVLGEVLGAHRLEGAGADVQRDAARADAARARARRAAPRRNAAPRSARRPRPGARRTRSGSARASSRVVGVRDVGRQRHVAVALEQRQRLGGKAQLEQRAVGAARGPSTSASKASAKRTSAAGLRRLAGAQLREHLVVRQHALDQRLDRAAAGLVAEQARLDHARVVERPAGRRRAAARAGRGTRGRPAAGRVPSSRREALRSARGMLRDQLGRQLEVEIARACRSGMSGIEGLKAGTGHDRWQRRRIVPWPTRPHKTATVPQPAPRPARQSAARPRALEQARPGARHRPRAAPAAALRGRDAHRAARASCATATPAQVEGVVTDCAGRSSGRAASSW